MTSLIAGLALALTVTQHAPETAQHAPAAAEPAEHGAGAQHAAPAEHGASAEHAPPAEHGTAGAGEAHAGAHAEAGHGGGHGASLPEVMMHHVANGEVLELPGFCDGFHWNCEVNLRELTGGGWAFQVGGVKIDMTPTKHTVMLWLAALLLTALLLTAVSKRSLVPHGMYNFFELLVQFVRDLAVSNIGKRDADRFVPYLCSAFFFILFMNLLGLVPFMATATANVSVTVGLALFTFFITQYAQMKAQGIGGYLAHMTGGVPKSLAWLWPIMIPVEFLGLFTKPFALTVRLFANMVAGHFVILALLGLIFSISIFVAPVSVALALAIFLLELFVAFVQAYIFTMLSALFIGAGLVHHDHGEGHGHEEHGHAGSGTGSEHHDSHASGHSPAHG
ncbi:MAG: ATP synthase F0 subunit A [Anaeromyxobacter sp. RBG_16_69_14]|nr:MAG: ATP synthase F0 subunit A [Anaeromyxobacter sp. RBG_16_69_14]